MTRRVIAALVLAAWVGSLGWLAARTLRAPGEAVAREEPLPVTPGAAYYSLRLDTTLVGFVSITLDTSVSAVRVTELFDVRVPDGDSMLRIMLRGETELSRGLRLRNFAYLRTVNGRRTAARGTVLDDSTLVWQVGQERRVSAPDTIRLPAPGLQTPGTLPLSLIFAGRLRAGAVRTIPVADPLTRSVRLGAMVVRKDSTFIVPDSTGRDPVTQALVPARWDTLQAWKVERRGLGAPATMWIDANGLPVAGELLPGLTLERRPFEIAATEYRTKIDARFPGIARPAGHVRLTAKPPVVTRVAALFPGLGADTAGWRPAGLSGGMQVQHGDTVVTGEWADAVGDAPPADVVDGLVPTRDTAVQALAARLVGGETDPARRVRRLASWTATELAPDVEADLPDVRVTLLRGRADPSARAAVFTALARAAGVPARAVAGLVAVGPSWRRHGWAEVWLDGRWTPVDPAFGTVPAHGAYVRLLVDAPADPVFLVPLAWRLAPAAPITQPRP